MNITLLLIGLLFLAFFLLPVFYIHRVQKNKGKVFLKHFNTLAVKHQLGISASDIFNSSNCIGIDSNLGKVFVLKRNDEQEETLLIDLNEIAKCNFTPLYRKIKGNKESNIVERIDLVFINKNSGTADKTITFYNNNETTILAEEQALAEKWTNIINGYLNSK